MGRYSKIPKRRNISGTEFYSTTKYPEVAVSDNDLYVITEQGDRYDLLADQYYGDSTLWWAISSANNGSQQNSYYVPQGVQLRIPANIQGLVNNFESVNQ
jgi:phage tail protein X